LQLFYLLVFITALLIFRLPYPNILYVFLIMMYSYSVEFFYRVKKRDQRFPLAQLLGGTDFALFPVAGYLCLGQPDMTALSYFLFFYPLALAHLGVNDLADRKNDLARGLKTVTVLYGQKGTAYWIMFFTALHYLSAPLLMARLGILALLGFSISFMLLLGANYFLIRKSDPITALKVLPLIHVSMLIYAVSIIAGIFFA
jgi:4-hydroxybenzoate polyprenyltransferase